MTINADKVFDGHYTSEQKKIDLRKVAAYFRGVFYSNILKSLWIPEICGMVVNQ